MALAAEDWGPRALRERCADMRRTLEVRALASADEIAAYWPGGRENDIRSRTGKWIYCYGMYGTFVARRRAEGPTADAAAMDALNDTPLVVRVTTGEVVVYPKSAHSLFALAARDHAASRLAWGLSVLRESTDPADVAWLGAATKALGQLLGEMVWIVTHPGVGLPYEEEGDDLALPEAIRALAPQDVLAIQKGHLQVNHLRLLLLKPLLAPDTESGERRLSFSTLIASVAGETKERPTTVLRTRSLVGLLAELQLRASAQREVAASVKAG